MRWLGHVTCRGNEIYINVSVSLRVKERWHLAYLDVDGRRNLFFIVSGVRLSPLGTAATTSLLYQPHMIDDGDCGAICGMKIGRGNRSTPRKPAPAPFCPPKIPHDQTRARTRAALGGKPATNRLSYGAASSANLDKYYVKMWAECTPGSENSLMAFVNSQSVIIRVA
jgi:hypothetical protein